MIYTVDEVSDLLDIPRPTLYRYLREYSIPHLRRAGKISIPEESFDRIKEARELHREGLGTASVRRRLREGNDLDAEELTERLDRLSGALESLQGDLRPEEVVISSSQEEEALQAILEKQDLLISSVSNLTEKVEDLLSTSPWSSRVTLGNREEAYEEKNLFEQPERLREARENGERVRSTQGSVARAGKSTSTTGVILDEPVAGVASDEPAAGTLEDDATTRIFPGPPELLDVSGRHEKFGALGRRRRRVVLALVLGLLASTVLALGVPAIGERAFEQPTTPDEQSVEEESQSSAPEVAEEVPPTPRIAEVPDLIGMTLPEAEDELTGAGLKLGAWNEIPTYEFPPGRVVTQGPLAGAEAEQDTPVDLIVSAGPLAYQPEIPGSDIGDGIGADQYPGGDLQYPNAEAVPIPGPF